MQIDTSTLPEWHPYNGTNNDRAPESYAWSSASFPPPRVGARVKAWQGKGAVVGYFTQGGFVGVVVRLSEPAEWWTKQNGTRTDARLFGREVIPTD